MNVKLRTRKTAQPNLDSKKAAGQIHALDICRIVAGSSAFGMLGAQTVLGIVALLMLLAGKPAIVRDFALLLPYTAAMAAAGWAAIKWIDLRILDRVDRVTSPDLCLPLLEMMGKGLPIGRIRPRLEQELTASLAAADPEWWDENARLMKTYANMALGNSRAPGWLRPIGWIVAARSAGRHCAMRPG